MMNFLKKQLWLQKNDFLQIAAVWCGGFALILLLEHLAYLWMNRDAEQLSAYPVASLVMLVAGILVLLIIGWMRFGVEFRMGLQMGATRRQMIAAELWLSLWQNLLGLSLSALFLWLEVRVILPALWPTVPMDLDLLAELPLWFWPLALVLTTLAGPVLGALSERLGRWAMLLWWLPCVLMRPITDGLLDLPAADLQRLGLGALAVFAAALVWSLHRLLHTSSAQ
ncbi:MAG: hypothetical protein IJ484_07340 [Oscillospiraceae bacterium]|nr:hypothetical protein [Oscillospiraceae bacterium]